MEFVVFPIQILFLFLDFYVCFLFRLIYSLCLGCWFQGNPDDFFLQSEQVPDRVKYIKRPSLRMVEALYQHPDGGTSKEEHRDTHVREV